MEWHYLIETIGLLTVHGKWSKSLDNVQKTPRAAVCAKYNNCKSGHAQSKRKMRRVDGRSSITLLPRLFYVSRSYVTSQRYIYRKTPALYDNLGCFFDSGVVIGRGNSNNSGRGSCDQRVCMSVCPPTHLRDSTPKFTKLFWPCCLWPWLRSPLMVLRYAVYFRFCRYVMFSFILWA